MLSVIFLLIAAVAMAQESVPPPPPPPSPAFMGLKGFPLACFDKPSFEQDGLEFFVCNGFAGLAGVRRKDDPAHAILVRDPDIAMNLNMKEAKATCGRLRFSVSVDGNNVFSFRCDGKEIRGHERFRAASKTDWNRFDAYLNK